MYAAWYLVSTPQGPMVLYRNVFTGETLLCGTASHMTAAALLAFLSEEGCGGWETIFQDGKFVGWIQAPLSIPS